MRSAREKEIACFKKIYCKNEFARNKMIEHFDVSIESFEDLEFGKKVESYATGCRGIENAFIMFKVVNRDLEIVFYPIFSETVGRQMVKGTNIIIPPKMSIFSNLNDGIEGCSNKENSKNISKNTNLTKSNKSNSELRKLITFGRSLMILHIDEPKPMDGIFKDIYKKLENNPSLNVKKYEVKSINTALKNFIKKDINTKNENFRGLQEYIESLKTKEGKRKIKNADFKLLVEIMQRNYPDEEIFF